MTEPFYESYGPDANYVRQDQFQYFWQQTLNILKTSSDTYYEIPKKELKEIVTLAIHSCIPNTFKDFGSFRGYAVFGIDNQIKFNISQQILHELQLYKKDRVIS